MSGKIEYECLFYGISALQSEAIIHVLVQIYLLFKRFVQENMSFV